MSWAKQRWIAVLFPLLLSGPFINRAYFVDDSYFVQIASWLKDHPQLPYHFTADDTKINARGWEEGGLDRMFNPLLHHCYLAFLLKVGGEREWFLRLGVLLLVCFSGFFLFELARRWTAEPLWATLIALATPAMWLSAHSLLIDSTMATFLLGGLYFFIRGFEVDSLWRLVLSGLLMGFCILTKYTGIFVIPLTGLWWMLRLKKNPRKWACFIPWTIGALFLGGYSFWTKQIYGQAHLLAASSRMVSVSGWPKFMVLFVFLSGVSLIPLVAWGIQDARRAIINGLFVVLLGIFLSSRLGGFSWVQGFLLSLWFITSILFVSFLIRVWPSWIYPRDYFLVGWLFGFIVMMFLAVGWVAGRYYVMVMPAITFLTVRLIENKWPSYCPQILRSILGVLLIISGSLAYADYKQAEPSRAVVHVLKEKGIYGGEHHYYLGDSFTMSYLRQEGWTPAFPATRFNAGDLVLAKSVTMPLTWFYKKSIRVVRVDQFDYPSSFPLKVMDYQGSAGFYASLWGALPFTFSLGSWERFDLFEVVDVLSDGQKTGAKPS